MGGQLSVALLKISMTTSAFSAQQAECRHCRGFRKHGCAREQTPHLPSRPPECFVHISGEITVMFKDICSLGNIVCTLEHCTVESTHCISDPECEPCQCVSLDKLLHQSESLFVYW